MKRSRTGPADTEAIESLALRTFECALQRGAVLNVGNGDLGPSDRPRFPFGCVAQEPADRVLLRKRP
jgi:hypothetical protein